MFAPYDDGKHVCIFMHMSLNLISVSWYFDIVYFLTKFHTNDVLGTCET